MAPSSILIKKFFNAIWHLYLIKTSPQNIFVGKKQIFYYWFEQKIISIIRLISWELFYLSMHNLWNAAISRHIIPPRRSIWSKIAINPSETFGNASNRYHHPIPRCVQRERQSGYASSVASYLHSSAYEPKSSAKANRTTSSEYPTLRTFISFDIEIIVFRCFICVWYEIS